MEKYKICETDTLYNLSLSAVVADFDLHQDVIRSFPDNVYFDICYKLYTSNFFTKLSKEFSNLDLFRKLLKVKDEECLLHKSFQRVMDCVCPLASELAETFKTLCSNSYNLSLSKKNNVIKLGFLLGRFLLDGGWYFESETVFLACLSLCNSCDISGNLEGILRCHTELLHIRSFCCKFKEGEQTFAEAQKCIEKMKELGCKGNFSCIYAEFSYYFLEQYNYNEAYYWIVESLKEINSSVTSKDLVRILCLGCRACISKRKFKWSELLIKQALRIAKNGVSSHKLCFATVMRCYGYYLLNADAVVPAAKTYQAAMNLLQSILGNNNLLVAGCQENLAYTFYSYGYNTGQFKAALDYADLSLSVLLNLLKEDNSLLICIKTVKALILEEIGLTCHDAISRQKYFDEARELHLNALHYALETFGEINLFTAKHYGNLGRLYQSMKTCQDAQDMLLKNIAIKEEILGPEDYEVGFSLGLLASLYAFDMKLYEEAEPLYLKSIEISKRMFGEGFSGLEYDYKGLLKVYTNLGLFDKVLQYRMIFHNWKTMRDTTAQKESEFSPLKIESDFIAPEDIMKCLLALQ